MAQFKTSCPRCGARRPAEADDLGREVTCAHCSARFKPEPFEGSAGQSSAWPWLSSVGVSPSRAPEAERTAADDGVPEVWKRGDLIVGLYEVRDVITSGGMGLVYRVRHRGWNLDLAVKSPRPEFFRQERDKQNFEHEAETWVRLGLHPHTVSCHYVRRLAGIPRVFAEYVAGGSLADWVRSGKLYAGGPPRALERILDVAVQFAWGLHYAHEQGLVHRDVKPGNVLLTPDGVAKVTDFGMAAMRPGAAEAPAADVTRSIVVSSGGLTPAYCSPEQASRKPVSRKTDVWSWAVSVLEMFTGATTWLAGEVAGHALANYLDRGAENRHLPRMPAPLAELLRACFRRDPEARPADMLEVVAVVQDVYRHCAGRAYPRETPRPAEALADSLNNQAVSLLDLNKHDAAEKLWEQALTVGPSHPEATFNLGMSRWRSGRAAGEEVRQKLGEACVSSPGEWLPLYLLAQFHLELGEWREAIEVLGRVGGPEAGRDEVRAALALARDALSRSTAPARTFAGHSEQVNSVCLSPDGRLAVSGGADQTLRLWQVATGRCLAAFPGHREWVTAVCLSADGRKVLSASTDRTLRLWRLNNRQCERVFVGHAKWVSSACLSPDGRHALSGGGDHTLRLWDLDTGQCVLTFAGHTAPVLSVALSPSGQRAASASRDGTVRLWDVATGACLRSLPAHAQGAVAVCFAPGGRQLLSGGADRAVRLWDVSTGACVRTFLGHEGGVLTVALSADGRHALSGGADGAARLWRLATGRCLHTFSGHSGRVNAVCFAAGGRAALSGGGDTLMLWHVPSDVPAPFVVSRVLPSADALASWTHYEQALERAGQALAQNDSVTASAWVREARSQPGYGRRPEAMSPWTALYLRLPRTSLNGGWETATFRGHDGPVTSVSLSRDGRYGLSGGADRTLRLWEMTTGQCLRTLEGHDSVVTAVWLSASGRHALSGGADRTVRLWEVATGRCLRTFVGHLDAVVGVCGAADGRFLLSGSADHTLRLWEAATGRCLRVLEGHAAPVYSVCWSGDGRHALSGSAQYVTKGDGERVFTSGQFKLWDVATGRCLRNFGEHAVTAVCFGADERHALSAGGQCVIQYESGKLCQYGEFRLWDTATGLCQGTIAGHTSAVTSVCLTTDGRFAVSGSTDRTVRVWEVASGRCLRTFRGHADAVTGVAVSTDGRHVLSAGSDGALKLWLLDWELADNHPSDWDEGARPYLEAFLAAHTPYLGKLPDDRRASLSAYFHLPLGRFFKTAPAGADVTRALTRRGRPSWNDEDFEELLYTLGCAGYGWLRPEGVNRKLQQMARRWKAAPPLLREEV